MKRAILIVAALCRLSYSSGGDSLVYGSAFDSLADGDTFYVKWHVAGPKDSVQSIINGRLGNRNFSSTANISPSKLDSTGTLKSDRTTADTLVADTLKARKLNGYKIVEPSSKIDTVKATLLNMGSATDRITMGDIALDSVYVYNSGNTSTSKPTRIVGNVYGGTVFSNYGQSFKHYPGFQQFFPRLRFNTVHAIHMTKDTWLDGPYKADTIKITNRRAVMLNPANDKQELCVTTKITSASCTSTCIFSEADTIHFESHKHASISGFVAIADSLIVGWSSKTARVACSKFGTGMWVQFDIDGESDTDIVEIDLPYTPWAPDCSDSGVAFPVAAIDDGSAATGAVCVYRHQNDTLRIYTDALKTAFAATGRKAVHGQLYFENVTP